MATRVYKFYGKCQWAKVHTPDEKYGNYQIDVFLDGPSMDLFKKSGLQLRVKDYEGERFVGFRRVPKKLIKGEMVDFGKPKVTDAVGREIDDLIGNGSVVAVTVSVFDTVKGKGHRLDVVEVRKLVPFGGAIEDAHGDDYDDEADEPDAPAPKAAGGAAKGLNDDLPF